MSDVSRYLREKGEPDPMEFARRFSIVLERSGLDMRDFASSIGCERKALINWRQGKHFPGIKTLARICATYDVSADWLLGLEGGRDG